MRLSLGLSVTSLTLSQDTSSSQQRDLVILFSAAALWLVLRSVAAALRAREAVVALNTELEDRVLRRTAALTRANDEIQRFAYIVSHDLRAPLVNIMGFTSELEVGAAALNAYFETGSAESREPARQAATDGSLRQRLQLAHQRIRELEADNQQLRHALAQALGDRRARHARDPLENRS